MMPTHLLAFELDKLKGQQLPNDDSRKVGTQPNGAGLPLRLVFSGGVIAAEVCLIAAIGHPWLDTHQIGTGPIAFAVALLFFGRKRFAAALALPRQERTTPVAVWIGLHVLLFAAMLLLDAVMLQDVARTHAVPAMCIALWCVTLPVFLGSVLFAAIEPKRLRAMARMLGIAWAYAAVCALLAVFFRAVEYVAWDAPSSWLGNHLAGYAFAGVRFLLATFYRNLYADAATRIIGVQYGSLPAFRIHVAGTCSGVEGLGLTLALTVGWILYERRRLRVARSLLLVIPSLALMWLLNLLRMTALVAIGAAGYKQLALTGFHTEAGWIAFAMVSVGFLLMADRMRWLQRAPEQVIWIQENVEIQETAANAYVLPFVAILGVSLLTRAFSTTGFEVLYPLRLLVVGAVLFAYRKTYTAIRWRVRVLDVAAGVTVGAAWAYVGRHGDGSLITSGLAVLSPKVRAVWLLCRVVGAVVAVPLAEELAFRGFLARWLVSEKFENVRYASLGVWSVLFSSLAFGGMHGEMWIAGSVSGVVFALLAKRRRSLGAAVASHMAANAVLATMVLARGAYGLW